MITPTDLMRMRRVTNQLRLIEEHLESMQRDVHGLEYGAWKVEVDALWKCVFEQINFMNQKPQQESLEIIKETWTTYLAHYAWDTR